MRYLRRIAAIILLTVFAAVSAGCSTGDDAPKPAEDEILLKIQLDCKEDIGLLIIDCSLDGVHTSGGMSNADRSLLKRDELLYWTLSREEFGNPAGSVNAALQFRVITDYCDPNFENVYPEELTVRLDEITFPAEFRETYDITISGDHTGGYQAVLKQP